MRRPTRGVWVAACVALTLGGGRADGAGADVAVDLADRAVELLGGPGDVAIRVIPPGGEAVDRIAAALVEELRRRAGVRQVAMFAGDARAAGLEGYELWIALESVGAKPEAVTALLEATGRDLWAEILGREPSGRKMAVTYKSPAIPDVTPPPPPPEKPKIAPQRTVRRLFFRPERNALDLGAPLLALAAGDVDADGVVELVALTTHEVVVLAVGKDSTKVEQRVSLPPEPQAIRSRDAVGSLLIADVSGDATPEVLARSSELAEGAILTLRDGSLAREATLKGHALCALRDEGGKLHVCAATLGEGVNYFPRDGLALQPEWKGFVAPALPERFLTMESHELVRADGTTRTLLSVVSDAGELRLYRAGEAAAWSTISDVGTAYEVADLDGDGAPEVIASTARPPGEGDAITVYTIAEDGATRVLHRGTSLRGGIAAIASGDFDGDGHVDVAAAVRLVGAARSDLWVLQ